jgi:hypothetical protein
MTQELTDLPGYAKGISMEPKEGYVWDAEARRFRESDELFMERFKAAHGLFSDKALALQRPDVT